MGRSRSGDGRPGATEPRELGAVLREAAAGGPVRHGLSLGRLVRAWEDVVGPALARETAPLGLDEGGLVVAASTAAWAAQVRFLAEEIRRRANDALGSEDIRAVRVIVRSDGRKPL